MRVELCLPLAIACALLLASLPTAAGEEPAAPEWATASAAEGRGIIAGEIVTARFRISYTARAEGAARALAKTIEQTRDHFREVLGRDWPGVTEVRVGLGRPELEQLAIAGGRLPGWAAALAYPGKGVILIEAHSLSQPDGQATLRHELSHIALGRLGGPWPRWFQEGLAVHLTGEQRYSLTHYATLFRAVRQDRVFHFEDLADGWPDHPADVETAYSQSAAFVGYLAERHGPATMGALLDGVRAGEPFETSFAKAFHTSLMLEEGDWRRQLPERYSWLPIVAGGSTLWALAAVITVVAWARRKKANAALRAEQAAQEVAEDAALRILEAEVSTSSPGPNPQAKPHPQEIKPLEDELDDDAEEDKPTLH